MGAAVSLDMSTLVVARIVSVVIFSIAVPIMTLRRNRPETLTFCWSLLMAIATWVTILAAVATQNVVVTAVYAACISSIVSLQWEAFAQLAGRRLHRGWYAAPPIGIMLLILALQLPTEAAMHASAIVLSVQLAAASIFVLREGSRVVRPSTAILTALGYAISFCSAAARPLQLLFASGNHFEPLAGDLSNSLPFIASYIGTTLIILSWLAALKDRAEARLNDLAFRDELTQLANRRALRENGRRLWSQARLQNSVFTMVTLDIDHFKQVNDRFGHDEGDNVLAAFGSVVAAMQPRPAVAARMGGEEFCFIYLGADARTVHDFVERLRDDFARVHSLPDGSPVRFSAGIAQSRLSDDSINALYRRADSALYNAKASGRDCTIISHAIAA